MTEEEVIRKINEAKEKNLTVLDLSRSGLSVFPKEIVNLTNLRGA